VEGKTDKNHRENVGVNKIYMKVMAAAKPIYLTVNMKLNATHLFVSSLSSNLTEIHAYWKQHNALAVLQNVIH